MNNTTAPFMDSLKLNKTASRFPVYEEKDESKLVLYSVMAILSFLSVIGTAGNALVLYVFSQKKDRLVSTIFILALALCDFTTCLIVIPYTIYMEYINFYIDSDVVCKLYYFAITSNIPFSAFVMVAIAVDRYLCICHPFLHAMTPKRAKLLLVGLVLFASCLGVIVALMFGVYRYETCTTATESEFAKFCFSHITPTIQQEIITKARTNLNTFLAYEHRNFLEHVTFIRHNSLCRQNFLYVSNSFQEIYQKSYTALFLVCLVIVLVLYGLVFKSVIMRRSQREKQKSKSLALVQSQQVEARESPDPREEETLLTTIENADNNCNVSPHEVTSEEPKTADGAATTDADVTLKPARLNIIKNELRACSGAEPTTGQKSSSLAAAAEKKKQQKQKQAADKSRRKSTRKDKNRMANVRTAAMLFVVTVVFVITFLPANLMANQVVKPNVIIFYMYFANNVANPVIYSFMNKNFRDDLRKLFNCRRL